MLQFDFIAQPSYISPLLGSLEFRFSQSKDLHTADLYTFTFSTNYTPVHTFNISLVPTVVTSTVVKENLLANFDIFNFNIDASYRFEYESHVINNAAVERYDLYLFGRSSCRTSSKDWTWDFTQQPIIEQYHDWTVFNINPDICASYEPTHEFRMQRSCYGEPCLVDQEIFNGFAVETLGDISSVVNAELITPHIAEMSETLGEIVSGVDAYTTEAHIGTITETLGQLFGDVRVYTSEMYEATISETLGEFAGLVPAKTTEAHIGTITAIMGEFTGGVVGATSEKHETDIAATMGDMTGEVIAELPENATSHVTETMGDMIGQISVTYEKPTFIQYITNVFKIKQEYATPTNLKSCSGVQNATTVGGSACFILEDAERLAVETCLDIKLTVWLTEDVCSQYEYSKPLNVSLCHVSELTTDLIVSVCDTLEYSSMINVGVCSVSELTENLNRTICTRSEDTAVNFIGSDRQLVGFDSVYTPDYTFTFSNDTYVPVKVFLMPNGNIYNNGAIYYSSMITSGTCSLAESTVTLNRHFCDMIQPTEPLLIGTTLTTPPVIDPPRDPVDPDAPEVVTPNPDEPIVSTIPNKEYYPVINTVTAQLPNGDPIEFTSMNVSCDSDSYSWTFSGTLSKYEDRASILPSSTGVATQLLITINGYQWTVLVEGIKTTRSFGRKAVSVTGRGITALLSAPYQKPYSLTQTALLTNQQVAESLLPYGWTLNWSLELWNLPAGTYTHTDKGSAKALAQYVQDCGGMLVPDRTAQVFHAMKRYPVMPWFFDVTTPNYEVPESVIINLSEEPSGQYGVDGVYVHGTTDDGIQALARLNGTAGSRLAATASNRYMVDPTALRSLAERILAAEAPQPKVKSVTTFMDSVDVGLFSIGGLVEVSLDGEAIKGIINSISVDVSLENDAPVVTQTFNIGESTNNTMTLLREVMPAEPTLLGRVVSTTLSTSKVALVDGGIVEVRGVGGIESYYYIKDNTLQSEAPNLTSITDIVI